MPFVPASTAPMSPDSARCPPRPGGTIIIAERDQAVRRLQALFLERAGFTVEFMDDGATALTRILQAPPDLLITEILIPKLDGLALCRALRSEPRTHALPIVVFSILGAAQRAADAGADVFLRKPLVDSIFVPIVVELTATQPHAPVETV